MTSTLTLGIDVGGTSIKAAAVDAEGGIRDERRMPTPSGDETGEKTVEIVARLIEELRGDHRATSAGVVVPGIVDEDSGVVVRAVNLGWENLPIRRMIAEASGLPIVFGQDVRSGAYAEASRGAGRGRRGVCVFVPIGTGIAAGIIVDGAPLASGGWAGEIGQLRMVSTPQRTGVDPVGVKSALTVESSLPLERSLTLESPLTLEPSLTLESVASASAIARRIGCADAETAAAMVRAGDASAIRIWDDAIAAIADSLAWTTAVVGADTLIIGGGLAEAGATLFDPLVSALHTRLGSLRRPDVLAAAFGDQAAIVGAGLLAHRWQVQRP